MEAKHVGILHPGAMGISLGATMVNTGHIAHWVSEGRSPETRARAEEHGLIEIQTLQELCDKCSVIVCCCPPHAATDIAGQVIGCSFEGVYADVNAISPQRTKEIGYMMTDAGIEYVDGGIIGGPAWTPGHTWLYLSGASADVVEQCFAAGPLGVEAIGDEIGKASALKMCYAANTKGTTALLCAIVAAADELGVRDELEKQWSRNGSQFAQNAFNRTRGVTAKAWRFAGEMEEIAATLDSAGLPDGFHLAACDVYNRIAKFKGADPKPSLDEVIDALVGRDA